MSNQSARYASYGPFRSALVSLLVGLMSCFMIAGLSAGRVAPPRAQDIIVTFKKLDDSPRDAAPGQRRFRLAGRDGAPVADLSGDPSHVTAGNPARQPRPRGLALRDRLGDLVQPVALAGGRTRLGTEATRRVTGTIAAGLADGQDQRLLPADQAAQRRLIWFVAAGGAATGALLCLSGWFVARARRTHRDDVARNAKLVDAQARTEEALRQSEAQARDLLLTVSLGTFMARDLDGTIRYWAKGCERLYGWTAEEAVGRSAHELLGTVFPVPLSEIEAALLARGEWKGDLRHRARDGRPVIVTAEKQLRRDGNGQRQIVLEALTDVTDYRHAENALRDSEARLKLVQQVGGIAYSDQLLSSTTVLISEEFARLYGLPPGQTEIAADDWIALVHKDDRGRLLAEWDRMVDTNCAFTADFRICPPGGAQRWMTLRMGVFSGFEGKPRRIIGAQQDVTEIVAARQALAERQQELEARVAERTRTLAETEARFRGIFDSQFQFTSLLSPDGMMLEVNRTALEAGGLSREQVVGKAFWETAWWSPAEQGQLRSEIARAAEGGIVRREVEITGADGRPIWVDFSLKPLRDGVSGRVMSIIAEGRDLTEKRQLANQLAQALKVQALGQLAGGIAHDFNNILQAVAGAAGLIVRRSGDRAKIEQLAGTLIAAASCGTSITQRLLSFARRGELRAETIATAELLESMREVLAHTLGTTIAVRADIPPDIPSLVADQPQLETAIINLGTNARDAMPDGGTLTLAAEAVHVDENGPFADLAPGDYVRLTIADTGTGMDAGTLSRVSEPFFTTKPLGKGTGLGLAMVKGFAEQSGGGLSIASAPGAGTTVEMWLPQAKAATASFPQAERGLPAAHGSVRILIVDDDDLVRETLAASLEAAGYGTLVASSGHEAIALLEAGEAVDAMVSDLSMPGMNGVATIERARALRPGLPCFLLTGYVGERAALSAGDLFTLVRKPVTGRALAAQIEACLEGARR